MLIAKVMKVSISWRSTRWTQRHSKMVGIIMLVFYAHASLIDFVNSMPIANKPSHTNFRVISIGLLVGATSAIAALIVCNYRQLKPRSNAIKRLSAIDSERNSTNWMRTRSSHSSFLRCTFEELMIAPANSRQNSSRGDKLRQKKGNRSFFFLLALCANTCLANLTRMNGVTGTQDSISDVVGYDGGWAAVIDNSFNTYQYGNTPALFLNNPDDFTIHAYVTIIFPKPVLVRTIFVVNRESAGWDRLEGCQFRVGFDTSPWLNPDCGVNPTMSGVFFCNQPDGLVGTRLSLYKYVQNLSVKNINIGELRAYSYIPVGYPDSPVVYTFHKNYLTATSCVEADLLQLYGLKPRNLYWESGTRTCFNENRLQTQGDTSVIRNLYYYVRFTAVRHVHAVTIVTDPDLDYANSEQWNLTVGNGIGDSIKSNTHFGTWPYQDRKEGKEFNIDAFGQVVGVYRSDQYDWFALRWIGIISTAIDCSTGTFDWSGGKQDWPAQVYVQTSQFTITGVIAATMSDCAVFHKTPTMSDGSALPSWITASGTTVTITISGTTPHGSYTIRQTAYLNDHITGYKTAVKDITFTVINCLTTVLTLPTAMLDFSIVVSGAANSQTFMPATDSEATFHGISSICGPRVYTIVEATPAAFVTITAPAVGQEYTSSWTLTAQASICAHFGTHTVTLRVTLQNYTGVPAATRSLTATVNSCHCTTINEQTLSPANYQITFAGTASTVLSFAMNTDTAGVTANNAMECGTKAYSTGKTWLSVLTPSDPVTQQFQLQAATSDYTLATTHTINLVIGFVNTLYTATLTQTFTLTLLHPCKQTTITTAQTIGTINFNFGAAVLTSFTNFSDSVATAYNISGLCGLTYSLSLAADATTYGVSIVTGTPNMIKVLTNTASNRGTSISLTLSANATPQQDSASQTVTFTVNIVDTCPSTTLSLGTQTLRTLTSKVYGNADTQIFQAATDTLSNSTGISNLCGGFTYSVNTEAQPFVTINETTRVLTLQSNDMTKIGTYTVTMSAKLTSYTAVPAVTKIFTATLQNPCLTTSLYLPAGLNDILITVGGQAKTQTFLPVTDQKATQAGVPSLCGPRVYTIVETIPASFITITAPADGQEYTSAWTMRAQSSSCTHVGTHAATLRATLLNYTGIPAAQKTKTATVSSNACCTTTINLQTLSAPSTYQITFAGTASTLLSFTMNTDSAGVTANNAMLCGTKTYSPDKTWLSVVTPTDPATQQFTLRATTSDYTLAATHTINLVVGFANPIWPSATVTQTLTLTLLHPCKQTAITTAQTIGIINFNFGATAVLTSFTNFTDSVATAYNIEGLCGLTYSLSLAADATTYGVSIVTGSPNMIRVLTNTASNKGTSISLTLSANATPQQDSASQIVTFTVNIVDTCPETVLSLGDQTLTTMTSTVTRAAATQTFLAPTDSLSDSTGISNLCGGFTYSVNTEAQPFVTINETTRVLTLQSDDMTKIGTYTVTLSAKLTSYTAVPAVTKTFTAKLVNVCGTATINSQTFTSPLTYQITYSTAASTILTFMMNSDSAGEGGNNPMLCGTKAYLTNKPWLSITTPADPLTQQFQLKIATNDYTLATTHTISLTVSFVNTDYPGTLTQSLTLILVHPCKLTTITTSQTIGPINFPFGGAATLTSFTDFADSIASQYGIQSICGLTYSLSLAADATTYGVSIVTGIPNQIQVFTNTASNKGTSISLTLSANATPLQDSASQTVTFTVNVVDTCPSTILSLGDQTMYTMQSTVTRTADTKTFQAATDSLSTSTGISNLCGGFTYSVNTEVQPFLTIDQITRVMTLQSNDMTHIGYYQTVTLSAKLTSYSAVTAATKTFTAVLVDPCLTTNLSFGAQVLSTMTSTVTQAAATQTFSTATDSASTSADVTNLCGLYIYSITQGYPFISINQSTLVVTLASNDMTKIGSYSVTLSASLANYPARPAVVKTFTAVLVDPCLTADLTLGSQIIPTMTSEIQSAATTHTFTAATNSASTLAGVTNLCGSYIYSITQNYPFVTINQVTHVLAVQSNNIAQIGSYQTTLSASLTNYPARPAVTKTFTIILQDPCVSTVLTLPTTLTDFQIAPYSGIPYTQTFMPATDSKAVAAELPSLCGPRVYAIVEPIPALLTTIIPPSAGQEFTSAWTLSKISNNCADSGVWTFTLRATLLNYPEVAPATKVITATVYNQCCATSINPQTLASSLTYQITYSTAPTVLMSFMMNTDSAGVATDDPLICGAKKYSTGKTWLTVTTPADPVTQLFNLVISTNDYSIASTYTINLVVSFVNDKWTGTLTQTFTLTLIHPCKLTNITTSQTISPITYPFGGAPVLQSFINFADSISTQYGVPGLCKFAYKLTLQAEATAYGVSVIPGTPSSQIRVQTNVAGQKGKSISLTLSANTTPQQQDTPSQTVTFQVNIQDTCPQTILSFGSWLPTSMTSKVTQAAAIQTFQAPVDSLSVTTDIPNLCGGFTYSITQGYSFLTINQTTRIITLKSTNMAQVGSYIATFSASLTDYPLASSASISFPVVLVDPCLTTTLTLPTSLQSFTVTSFTKVGFTQAFMPATDSAAIQAEFPSLCGPRVYTILETQPRNFMKIIQPVGNLFTTAWTLEAISNDLADAGVWTVTLQATLQNYPTIAPAKQVITGATVIDPCPFTQIRLQSLSDLSSVVLGPATTQTFMAATDSQSDSYGQANVCGSIVYSISHTTFLSVDALSMVVTLSSNDMAAIGAYTATLTATLTQYPAVPAATSSFRAILVDPCLQTSIPSFTLPTMTIVLHQAAVTQSLSSFFVNSVATAKSMPALCGSNYAVTLSPDKPFLTYQAPTLYGSNTNNTQLGMFSIVVTIALGNYCQSSTIWTVITTCAMQPPVVPLQSVVIKIGKDPLPYLIPFTQPDSVQSCGQTASITSLPPNLVAGAFASLTPNLITGGSVRVEHLTLNEVNTYTITLTNVIPGVGTQLTTGIEVIITDACIDAFFETQPNPITQMRAVLASTAILEQSFKIYTDLERLVASSSCPVTAEVVPFVNFISVNNSNTKILVDTAILTQLIPASVKIHSFVLQVKSSRYPTVVPQANYSFELVVTCVTTSIQLVSSSLTDINYEVDPIAPGPMSLPLPIYRCLPCLELTTYTRTLVMEQNPQEPLSRFMTTADAAGAIRVAITNPWDTGKYSYRVVARETNGPAGGPSNNQVTFNLTLTCTVRRFFNREKSLANIVYTIPSSLISPVDIYEMPVYATEPAYCQLYEIESSLVFERTNDFQAEFVQIDNSVKPARVLVQENDPTKVGVYSFYIRATEPATKFIDESVRFQITIVCLIEQFAPVLNEKTVYEMTYLIRSGTTQFNLPSYTWKPKTCLKEVRYKLVIDGMPDAKFPPFFKINLDSLVVNLNGGRDQYEFANQEFRFRLIAETTDNQYKNSDYSFLIRTQFKNSAPKFMDPLETQQLFVGLKYEVLLPEMIDDDGDEIRTFSIAPKPSWLQLRRDPNKDNQLRIIADLRLLTKADVGNYDFKITLTDEFGAARVVKQTVWVMYDANQLPVIQQAPTVTSTNSTSSSVTKHSSAQASNATSDATNATDSSAASNATDVINGTVDASNITDDGSNTTAPANSTEECPAGNNTEVNATDCATNTTDIEEASNSTAANETNSNNITNLTTQATNQTVADNAPNVASTKSLPSSSQNEKDEVKDQTITFEAVEVSVPNLATQYLPPFKAKPRWEKPKFNTTADENAEPQVFAQLVEGRCAVKLSFSQPMDFSKIQKPEEIDVKIIVYKEKASRYLRRKDEFSSNLVEKDMSSRQLSIVDVTEDAGSINYSWVLQQISPTDAEFSIELQDPYSISVGDTVHVLQIRQKEGKFIFRSYKGVPMTTLNIELKLPAQIAPADQNTTSNFNAVAGRTSIAAMFGTLIGAILAGQSLNILFSMVGSLQFTLYLSVLNTNFPGNANEVFKRLMVIMQFDFVPDFIMTPFYKLVSSRTNDEDISQRFNQRFDQMGYKTSNWVVNLGSNSLFIGIIIAQMLVLPIPRGILFALRCQRKLRLKIKEFESTLYWNQPTRFILELFFELALICAIRLQIHEMDTNFEKAFTYAAIALICFLVFFAWYIAFILIHIRRDTHKIDIQAQYGTLFEGLNHENRIGFMSTPFFCLCRLIFIIFLIFYQEYVTFQVMMITLVAFVQVWFASRMPYERKLTSVLELMNQICTYTITVFCFSLTDYVPHAHISYKFGWAIIGIIGLFIAVNIVVQTFDIFKNLTTKSKQLYQKCRQRRAKAEQKKASDKEATKPEAEAPNTTHLVTNTEQLVVQHTNLKPIKQQVYEDVDNESGFKEDSELENSKGFMLDIHFDQSKLLVTRNQMLTSYAEKTEMRPLNVRADGVEVDEESLNVLNDAVLHLSNKKDGTRRIFDDLDPIEEQKESSSSYYWDDDLKEWVDPSYFGNKAVSRLTQSEIIRLFNHQRQMDYDLKTDRKIVRPARLLMIEEDNSDDV